MNIQLFRSFHKRENSTKQPSLSDQTSDIIAGYLREPTSIINPIVKFKRENFHFSSTVHSPHLYTYAYMEDFQRYYYIKDWVWQDGVWEAHMKVDVLASFADEIFATEAYIERTSALQYINGNIIDKMYPAMAGVTTEKVKFTPPWQKSGLGLSDMFYIMGVVGKNANNGVNYYMLSPNQMASFTSYLMSDDIYSNMGFGSAFEPMTVLTAKAMYNPLQYVTSCFFFPMDRDDVLYKRGPVNMQIGPYDIGSQAGELRAISAYEKYGEFGVGADWFGYITVDLPPVHPQAPDRGAFLQYSPYTRYTLVFPPFGTIPIDPSIFRIGDQLRLELHFDGATGKGRLVINRYWYDAVDGEYKRFIISEHSTMIGVPIQLNQVSVDYLKASIAEVNMNTSAASGLTAALSGFIGMGINSIANVGRSMGDYINSLAPQLLTEGTAGSTIGFFGDACLEAQYTPVAPDDLADLGRPSLYKALIAVVGNSGGDGTYIKCSDVHIDFKCLEDERNLITNYLLGGFFYE